MLETALGALRALHLARAADGDGRFEIWLAVDRHYLPVRVLRSDDKGNEMELVVLSIVALSASGANRRPARAA